VDAILDGRWQERYPSRSEADFALAYLTTHFTRAPNAISAILVMHSLKRDHPNFAHYCAITTANELASREADDRRRQERLRSLLVIPEDTAGSVYDVTSLRQLPDMYTGIRRFASITVIDEFARGGGWRRLPVLDMAALYRVHRQTVWRQVQALVAGGTIEYDVTSHRADAGPRRGSLIRLIDR
jgi:hypothetical protein